MSQICGIRPGGTVVLSRICGIRPAQLPLMSRICGIRPVSVKHQICGNIKMAFFLKFSYSLARAVFTYLGRGGHF